jgi:hypothetical protein
MSNLVVTERIPAFLIVESGDLVRDFKQMILPRSMPDHDVREIMNQISDAIGETTKARPLVTLFRTLPMLDRMVSRKTFDQIEHQHVLRAATFELAWGMYKRLEGMGAYSSSQFLGKFPYVFDKLEGTDSLFIHVGF